MITPHSLTDSEISFFNEWARVFGANTGEAGIKSFKDATGGLGNMDTSMSLPPVRTPTPPPSPTETATVTPTSTPTLTPTMTMTVTATSSPMPTATQALLPGAFDKINPTNGASGHPVPPTLSWQGSAEATSYKFCIDTTDDGKCDGESWHDAGTNTSAPAPDLHYNSTYYWQVRANNAAGTTDADGGIWYEFTTGAPSYSIYLPMTLK